MGGFMNVGELAAAVNAGKASTATLRKVASQANTAGWWTDTSMWAGIPQPNFYASEPLVAATLNPLRGIFHGTDKTPEEMFLTEISLVTPSAVVVGQVKLLDYLIYYPFVDLDDTGAQTLDNSVTLPRYADGEGVRAMMVCAAPTLGSGSFTFDYVNQDGAAKTSPVISCSVAAATIGSLVTSEQGTAAGGVVFLPLASGDTGIRSVTSLTMLVPNGGLGTIVLVYPLGDHVTRETSVPSEKSWVVQQAGCPKVEDGAFLGLIVNGVGAIAAASVLAGRLQFAWK